MDMLGPILGLRVELPKHWGLGPQILQPEWFAARRALQIIGLQGPNTISFIVFGP